LFCCKFYKGWHSSSQYYRTTDLVIQFWYCNITSSLILNTEHIGHQNYELQISKPFTLSGYIILAVSIKTFFKNCWCWKRVTQ
jgi:hypothetical protein